MREQIKKKKYYKITFTLASPLAVGSGNNLYTDKDIVKDGRGIPYIPGTALAGIARGLFDENDAKKYFGFIPKLDEAQKINARESRIVIYDANITDDTFHTSKRDFVALDEWKTAKAGSKFDMEILEPGVSMVTYMEQDIEEGDLVLADEIARAWLKGEIVPGAKSMRGFGAVKDVTVRSLEFDFTKEEDVERWLDFDLYEAEAWKDAKEVATGANESREPEIILSLEQVGGISIRRYTTRVNEPDSAMPDYEQLTVHGREGQAVPVIPGTTWTGAFRNHMKPWLSKEEDRYFGFVEIKKDSKEKPGTEKKQKSKIRFSESQITGAHEKILSRNAIDRFTGGAVGTALFTEKTYFGGHTELRVSFGKDAPDGLLAALAAAITDLHYGFLSVGGLTSIGRGVFRVTKVNGREIAGDMYEEVLRELKAAKEEA